MSKSKNNGKNSFVFYDSFLSAMKHLNDAEFRECVLKIRDYALEGVNEESSSPMVNVIMALAKPNLDSARRRYMASVENGKKGAEFGKLGGAPKGNQNARKNNPQSTLKQPLDVDVNDDVEVDENVNEEVNVEVDAPSGSTAFQSSFSNSSNSSLTYEANESELLEEEEENNERNLGLDLKGLVFVPASEMEKESHINSNIESNNTPPVSPCSEKEAECSAARPRRREVKAGEYEQSEYYRLCLNNYVLDLADMRKGILPNDGKLFWQAVKLYESLRGCSEQQAVSVISSKVSEIAQRDN